MIFENFEIALVLLGQCQNFQKLREWFIPICPPRHVLTSTNCIIVDYFILLCHGYFFSIVFVILFLFSFYSSISFTPTLQILFDLLLHLLFYLVFALLYLLSFLSLFIPRNLMSQKCRVRTKSFNFLVFSDYYFLRRRVLNFT